MGLTTLATLGPAAASTHSHAGNSLPAWTTLLLENKEPPIITQIVVRTLIGRRCDRWPDWVRIQERGAQLVSGRLSAVFSCESVCRVKRVRRVLGEPKRNLAYSVRRVRATRQNPAVRGKGQRYSAVRSFW